MSLTPLIDRLAFLPAAQLQEVLTVFRGALDSLGSDLALNQRLDSQLGLLAQGETSPSPQLITHLFEWGGAIDVFATSRASVDADFAARLARLTGSFDGDSIVPPLFRSSLRRTMRDLNGTEKAAEDREPVWPQVLAVDGRRVQPEDRDKLYTLLQDLFELPVPVDDFLDAFRVDVPGYRMALLVLDREDTRVVVTGRLSEKAGEAAGVFQREIGVPPPVGGEWRASTRGYNPQGDFGAHTGKGLARGLHQRFFRFLHRLGVDRMYLSADKAGHYVWPHLGFKHRDPGDLVRLREIFRGYLSGKGFWSPETEGRWEAIQVSWDFCDFTVGESKVGRDFLLSLEGKIVQDLYFPVEDPADPSWGRLFRL